METGARPGLPPVLPPGEAPPTPQTDGGHGCCPSEGIQRASNQKMVRGCTSKEGEGEGEGGVGGNTSTILWQCVLGKFLCTSVWSVACSEKYSLPRAFDLMMKTPGGIGGL